MNTAPIEETPAVEAKKEILYTVTWQVEVEALNPRKAAEEARNIQRSYSSKHQIFNVQVKDPDDGTAWSTPAPAEIRRVDLSLSVYDEARQVLIDACTHDMYAALKNGERRLEMITEGFAGVKHMRSSELAEYVRGMAGSKSEEVLWALEIAG
jgi:hypothetical protein